MRFSTWLMAAAAWGGCAMGTASGQGTIVSYSHIASYSKADVETILTNFGVPVFLAPPQFNVDAYKVTYITPNAQGTGTTTATGAIVIPAGVTCPLPMAAYMHGTTSNRYDVPSYASDELKLGLIFSAVDGYIVSLPDYLGLGDSPGFHPYVHAASEASAGLDLLRATRTLQDSLNYHVNDQLFIFGYSQGGHAAMSLFKNIEEHHSSEFLVTAAAPMSGPYDVSGVQARTITDSVAYSSPGYLPYVVLGYQEAYGNLYTNLSDVFKSPYDTLLPDLFDGTHSFGYIDNFMPDTPNHMLQPAMFQDFINNPNNPMRIALAANDLYKWVPSAPLNMYYCTNDEQVFYGNALVAQDTMLANGATGIQALNMGHLSHGDCIQGCMINAKAFFGDYADMSGGIQVTVNVTASSSSTANDGTAQAIITGGQAPYTLFWSTGDTTVAIDSVDGGIYTVRVSDARGCFYTADATITELSGVGVLADAAAVPFSLAPNPASHSVQVRLGDMVQADAVLLVRDMLGRTLHLQSGFGAGQVVELDVAILPTGMYIVELQQGGEAFSQKLIVR